MKFPSIIILIALILSLSACDDVEFDNSPDDNNQQTDSFLADSMVGCISPKEQALIDTIQAYRLSRGLPKVPISKALTVVADAHVKDLNENAPHEEGSNCNMHSWSAVGSWSACCYTPDHDEAACMWDKPRELTDYEGNGYEIAYGASDITVSPKGAIRGWQTSYAHNNVILNKGQWRGRE
jgi:hypothetical protein